jgi:hypothetical protein
MRNFFALASAVIVGVASAAPTLASNISEIEGMASGTAVMLDSNPVVTALGSVPGSGDGYTYSNYAIFAQDNTGGVDLFGHLPTGDTYVPAVGDDIGAAGTYSPFDSIPEIATLTSLTQVSSGNTVPAPLVVTLPQLVSPTNSILGYVVQLNNVLITQQNSGNPVPGSFPHHANGTYTLTDSMGNNPTTLFQWASSYSTAGALGGTAVPTGLVNIVGTVDSFDGTTEVIPFSITQAPEPASVGMLGIGGLGLLRRRRR